MKKRKSIILSITTTIITVGIILFGFLNSNFNIINLNKEKENLALPKITGRYVTMVTSMGDKSNVDGEIRIYSAGKPPDNINERTYDYTNGYCMKQGASFYGYNPKGYQVTYKSEDSGYDRYDEKIRWLFDNIVVFNNPEEIEEYKNRLAKILDYNNLNIMNNKEIFCAQQYAIWNIANGFGSIPNNQIGELAKKLIEEAKTHPYYSANGAYVTITDNSNKKIEKIGNDFWVGPYHIDSYGEQYGKIYKLIVDNVKFNGKSVKIELYTGKNSGTKIDNNSYRTQSGDIYIKIPASSNNNFSGLLNQNNSFSANITVDDYKTSTRYWECETYSDWQPAVTIQREHNPNKVSASGSYSIPDGEYHMNIVKKATWDTDTDNKTEVTDKYKNSIGGAKFKITQSGRNFKQVNTGKTKDKDELVSVAGSLERIVFNNDGSNGNGQIKITESNYNNEDYYSIEEETAPNGYKKNDIKFYFGIRKKYDSENKKYVIDQVICYKNENHTDEIVKVNATKDIKWIRIGFDGKVLNNDNVNTRENYAVALDFHQTAITITYKDPPEGSYRLHIAKKPSNSVSENEYKDCLGGAEFVVKQNRNGGTGDYNLGVSRKTEDNNESAFDHDPDDVVKPENRIVRTVSGKLTEKIAFSNHGSSYLGDIKVNEDNCNTEDIYTFKETKAPFGYTNERIGLKIGITKKLSEDKKTYVIDKIKYYGIKYNVPIDKNDDSWADDLNNVITEISASGDVQWLKIGKDGSVVTDDNDCIISLDFHNTAITVTYKDKKIEGNYDISLAKYNSDDVAKITSQKDYDSLKNVSGIKFNVLQISQTSRIYTNTVETKSKPVLITNERKYSRTIYYRKW